MLKNLYFLYHKRWENTHAEPFLRYQKELGLTCIPCPSNSGVPERLWPEIDDRLRIQEINGLLDEIKNPTAILVHQRCLTQELLRRNLPLIILEHTDGTSLEISRYLIGLPNILGVIKGTRFLNKQSYNAPHREGMFHGIYLNDPYIKQKAPELILDLKLLDKIELGYSFGCFPANRRFIDYPVNYDVNRSIKISFVGNLNYPRSRLITKHRQAAAQTVKNLGGLYKSQVLQSEFDQILLNSSLCVSPYGYGACYRSFESLYAGCITIQPYSEYLESWPNVYVKNQTYFEVQSDFSNLAEIQSVVLDNYRDLKELRKSNREMLINSYFTELLLDHLQGILDRCLSRQ